MIELLSEINLNKYIDQLVKIDNEIVDVKGDIYSVERWTDDNFLCNRPGKWKYSIIASENEVVQGCSIVTEYEIQKLHINRFFVNLQLSRCGIASMMTDYLYKYIEEYQIKEINLFVNVQNKDAISFYEHKGFHKAKGKILQELMQQFHRKKFSEQFFLDDYGNQYFAYVFPQKK